MDKYSDLYQITQMHIDYISNLDYIDLRNLCSTNKQFATVCKDNTILRSILYNSNKYIKLPPNFDIAGALDELWHLIRDIIDDQYPTLNDITWINKKEFINQQRRFYYNSIYVALLNMMADDGYNETTFYQGIKLFINKSTINIIEGQGKKPNELLKIILPPLFTEYIGYSILNWTYNSKKEGVTGLVDLVLDLFFLKKLPNDYIVYLGEY